MHPWVAACELSIPTLNSRRYFPAFTLPRHRDPESIRGFTLLELLIVVGIIGLLLVLIAPAFTYIKGGTDVTSAAYTIKGVLDTARTYAKANNTYTWVGFRGRARLAINQYNRPGLAGRNIMLPQRTEQSLRTERKPSRQ